MFIQPESQGSPLLGYVNDLKQHCNSPIDYEVKPSNGEPCDSGWMNIGAGYCKKKTLGIF